MLFGRDKELKKSSLIKRNTVRTVAALLISAMVISCFGCGKKAATAAVIGVGEKPVYPGATDLAAHYCDTATLKEIDTSGLITLLFDSTSGSIGVRTTGSTDSKLWTALPLSVSSSDVSDEAEVIGLEIIHNGKKYLLNSQDSCVAHGGMYSEETENGFVVTYLIGDDSDCLQSIDAGATDEAYTAAANGSILFKIQVTYTLKDGCLYAKLVWKNLGNSEDILANIDFLGYFGASPTAVQGDFLLVPDGSGAVIDTASAQDVDPVSISVYGNDFGVGSTLSGVVAAYGMKSGNDAFAAVIEQGDAVAYINANKAQCGSNYNRVGSSFAVTPLLSSDDSVSYASITYTGEIGLCFRFLSGANATYAGLAAACREQLIRSFTLSTGSVVDTDYLPMLINIVGSADNGGFFARRKKLTTFAEATDILARVKSKGINNVYLRYSGALTGGLNSANAGDASVLRSLGGKRGLGELNEYAHGQNFTLFLDVSLITDRASGHNTAKTLSDKKAAVKLPNLLTKSGFIEEAPDRYAVKLDTLEDTVLSVLNRFEQANATGYCISDAGSLLYTDFSTGVDRQNAAKTIREQVAPLSTKSAVMVDYGNFYCLKNADVVSNLPMTCGRTQTESYKAVPFVQIILHGIVDFCYDGINLENDSKKAFLRSIEYGALPGFSLTNRSFDGSDKYAKAFTVDEHLGYMYDCYSKANETLNDLRSSRITNHYSVTDGIFCTEYESTTKIYVNYTDKPATVSGITVAPGSFIRVN